MKVDGIEIVIESNATKACAELDRMIAKLNKVNASILFTGKAGKGGSVSGLTSGLKSYTTSASKATKSTASLAAMFGKFYASCFLAIRGVKALGRAIGSSMDYIETYNYFNVITDKIGTEFGGAWKENGYSSAEEYSKSFRDRLTDLTTKMTGYKIGAEGGLTETGSIGLGLDPEAITNFEASIASITNAVGLIGETSINTSTALTMLSADMSSLKNVDLETVMTNFQSGLIGQSRALYKYGIDITNTKLAEYALAEGISKKVSEMTQAEKMQLRMIAILDQSKISYGDMANTINSVANQYRVFKQQVSNLARTFGNLFVPILQSVLPIINGITIALTRMFSWIGTIIYGSEKWKKIMDGVSKGYNDTGLEALGDSADDATSALEDADKAAKKLKSTIFGYDELNVATDPTGGKEDKGNLGGGIDLSGAISDALSDYESVWDKALEDMEDKVGKLANNILKVGKYVGTNFVKGFKKGFVSDKLEGVSDNFKRIKESNMRVWNSPEVISAIDRFVSTSIQMTGAIDGAFASVGTSLSYGITTGIADAKEQMEKFNIDKITGVFNNLTGINTQIIEFAGAIGNIGTAFESEGFTKIVTFFEKVREFFAGTIMENLTGFALDITKIFTDPIETNQDSIKGILESLMTIVSNLISPLEDLFDVAIKDNKNWEDSWLHKLLTGFNDVNLVVTSGWLDTLNDKLGKLAEFTSNHNGSTFLDSIQEKLEKITQFCQPAITMFQGFFERLKSGFEGVSIIVQAFGAVISEKLSPVISGIGDKFESVIEFISGIWTGLVSFFNVYIIKPIDSAFGGLWDSISGGLKNGMNLVLSIFENAVNALIGGINSKIDGFNNLAKGAAGFIGKDYSGINKIPEINIPKFVNGGFPEDGLFMANHNELVGQFGNGKTAVANNEQITSGIRDAVVDGMMQVVMATSGNSSQSNNRPLQLVMDGRVVAETTYSQFETMSRQGLIPKFT